MTRGEAQQVDSKWKFPKAFEGVARLFGAKKEQPEPEPDLERFSVLGGLKNTDKKSLFALYNHLRERDTEKAKTDEAPANIDISAHIIELLTDEVASGEVTVDELDEFAYVLEDEIEYRAKDKGKKRTKKTPQQVEIDRWAEEHRIGELTGIVRRKIKGVYEQKARFGDLTPEEKAALEHEPLMAKSTNIAEKIRKAPSKFDKGLSMYMEATRTDLAQKEQDFLAKQRVTLDAGATQKILGLHPNDYEQVVDGYEEVFARAGLLGAQGMAEEAQIAKNLDIFFSPLDGAMLRTPAERLAYIEDLLNPTELKAKWRQEKIYGSRDKATEFVEREVIPELLANNVPFEEVVKQMHWFLVSGSFDQLDACKTLKKNMAGEYRNCYVSAGNYPCPDEKLVPEMMAKLAQQVELFSAQLEAMKESESPESFEEKVHQFACHVTHRFVDIHPMMDGNGRTARSLRSYIMSKHLGVEKMREYNAAERRDNTYYGDARAGKLLEHLRFGQPSLRSGEMDTYSGSTLATKFQSTIRTGHPIGLGVWHEPIMAHLGETSIQTEVFDNKKLVSFASHAKEIIDGKQTYGWY